MRDSGRDSVLSMYALCALSDTLKLQREASFVREGQ
jgi:hypothetical protein